MKEVVLIGCSKSKLDKKAPAKELYTGQGFKKKLIYSILRGIENKNTYVISALHHLVDLEQELEPYELTLSTFKKTDRVKWAKQVLSELKERYDIETTKFIILAGKDYYEFLEQVLPNTELPLKGLGMGNTNSFLKNYIEREQ